ncbi:hypothetical protein Ahy_B01g053645 [Arachis hypogaea]|uniref:Transposase MuDR plant domain-containing protein n=1 Tax=Arachis hypogaea TaxID=3818 RepID=A0A445AS70_ARAHY|nr:hypothetical protein Ahy_B01g053645 [Arachis hypogaea]
MLRRVSSILYRNPTIVFGGLILFDIMPIIDKASMQNTFHIHRQTQVRQRKIELYAEFENVEAYRIQNYSDIEDDRAEVYEGLNSDSEEDFEATYEAGDEDEDGDVGVEATVENVVVPPTISQPMDVPPFMRNLDLDAMHALELPEYADIGVADSEDGEFKIGMEYSSRKSIVTAIRSYTISMGVDYNVYESEPQMFFAKCKTYGHGHIGSNFLRAFKVLHLQKIVVNIGYSRTVEEYNINYKKLQERVLKSAQNLPMLALVRATYYWLNELFTRKSVEAHDRKWTGFTFFAFAQQ